MFDPEATIQDADILMAEYAAEARRIDAARARGVCQHSSSIGVSESGEIFYPEQVGLTGEQERCTEGCGRVFESFEDLMRASIEASW